MICTVVGAPEKMSEKTTPEELSVFYEGLIKEGYDVFQLIDRYEFSKASNIEIAKLKKKYPNVKTTYISREIAFRTYYLMDNTDLLVFHYSERMFNEILHYAKVYKKKIINLYKE